MQLGYQILNDICKKPKKLDGCCCAAATQALWSLQLPVNIRAHISDREFTKDTYKEVFEAADKCFNSAKQVAVATVAALVAVVAVFFTAVAVVAVVASTTMVASWAMVVTAIWHW